MCFVGLNNLVELEKGDSGVDSKCSKSRKAGSRQLATWLFSCLAFSLGRWLTSSLAR